jgi:hypothetical protein
VSAGSYTRYVDRPIADFCICVGGEGHRAADLQPRKIGMGKLEGKGSLVTASGRNIDRATVLKLAVACRCVRAGGQP